MGGPFFFSKRDEMIPSNESRAEFDYLDNYVIKSVQILDIMVRGYDMFWSVNGKKGRNIGDRGQAGHLIEMRGVVKAYDTPVGPFQALKGIDLTVERGEFVAIVGKSGSGKSTLLNMIAGIDRPTEGEVIVNGTVLNTLSEDQIAGWRGKELGIIFQFFQLLPTLTVVENIMLPMEFVGLRAAPERYRRAMQLLEMVGLADQAHKMPTALSGGQQQRVAIARALANDPPLLVADEPTGNLDSKTADAIFRLFEELVAEGKSIVMVTHDPDLADRADRAVTVLDGMIVEEATVEAYRIAPPDFVEGYIEGVYQDAAR